MTVTTRLVRFEDVPAITDLVKANRDLLASWEPERNEEYFTFGTAPQYLNIAGRWQDHVLFQLIAPEPAA